jgi:hypothetical protein
MYPEDRYEEHRSYHQPHGSPFGDELRRTFGRLRRWAEARPTESWLFFLAGFVLAAIIV